MPGLKIIGLIVIDHLTEIDLGFSRIMNQWKNAFWSNFCRPVYLLLFLPNVFPDLALGTFKMMVLDQKSIDPFRSEALFLGRFHTLFQPFINNGYVRTLTGLIADKHHPNVPMGQDQMTDDSFVSKVF